MSDFDKTDHFPWNESYLNGLNEIDEPMRAFWVSAAQFHFRNIQPDLAALSPLSRVLEIGCGAGILLNMLARTFPELDIYGAEPFGDGFGGLAKLASYSDLLGTKILPFGYEELAPEKPLDLIYSVNVLEHLPDWRHFLDQFPRLLVPGGRGLILCPNYGFPFDPHFNRPVIGPKRFMRWLYRRRIETIEKEFDMPGLWDSLNFVRLSQIKRHVRDGPLQLRVRHSISELMIDRLVTDQEMSRHMPGARRLGLLAQKLGIAKLLQTQLLENAQPYIFIELTYRP